MAGKGTANSGKAGALAAKDANSVLPKKRKSAAQKAVEAAAKKKLVKKPRKVAAQPAERSSEDDMDDEEPENAAQGPPDATTSGNNATMRLLARNRVSSANEAAAAEIAIRQRITGDTVRVVAPPRAAEHDDGEGSENEDDVAGDEIADPDYDAQDGASPGYSQESLGAPSKEKTKGKGRQATSAAQRSSERPSRNSNANQSANAEDQEDNARPAQPTQKGTATGGAGKAGGKRTRKPAGGALTSVIAAAQAIDDGRLDDLEDVPEPIKKLGEKLGLDARFKKIVDYCFDAPMPADALKPRNIHKTLAIGQFNNQTKEMQFCKEKLELDKKRLDAFGGDDAPELFKESLKVGKMVAKAEIMKEERLKSEVHQQVIKHSLTAEALELRKQRIKNNTDSIKMASARLATAKAHDDKKLQIIDNLMNHDIGLFMAKAEHFMKLNLTQHVIGDHGISGDSDSSDDDVEGLEEEGYQGFEEFNDEEVIDAVHGE